MDIPSMNIRGIATKENDSLFFEDENNNKYTLSVNDSNKWGKRISLVSNMPGLGGINQDFVSINPKELEIKWRYDPDRIAEFEANH